MLLFIILCPFSGAEASVEEETADQSCVLNVCFISTHSVNQFPSALTLFRESPESAALWSFIVSFSSHTVIYIVKSSKNPLSTSTVTEWSVTVNN